VLPLVRVSSKCKINFFYYTKYVLTPIIYKHLPKLYAREMHKVYVHHDPAPAHISQETANFTEEVKSRTVVTIISKAHIPVKCPDGAPMDFFGFGYLKQHLNRKRCSTLDGLWKAAWTTWSSIDPSMVGKVFTSWKRHLRMISG